MFASNQRGSRRRRDCSKVPNTPRNPRGVAANAAVALLYEVGSFYLDHQYRNGADGFLLRCSTHERCPELVPQLKGRLEENNIDPLKRGGGEKRDGEREKQAPKRVDMCHKCGEILPKSSCTRPKRYSTRLYPVLNPFDISFRVTRPFF